MEQIEIFPQEVKKKRGRPRKDPNSVVPKRTRKGLFSKDECLAIIKSFLVSEEGVNWSLEMGTFYNLCKRYPDATFWRNFRISYKIKSMLWFVGQGKSEIEKAWWLSKLDWKAKDYIVEGKEKVGEDYVPAKKQLSLRDILTTK